MPNFHVAIYTLSTNIIYTMTCIVLQEAALKRSQRAARFGLSMEEGEEGGSEVVEKRQARAKRFGTKLLAHHGQPIKLMDKYVHVACVCVCERERENVVFTIVDYPVFQKHLVVTFDLVWSTFTAQTR